MTEPTWRSWAPGVRVVVRRLRDDLPATPAADEPRHTDVLGEVLAVDDDGVLVRTRTADVRVPAHDIVLTKLVPPPPAPRPRRSID